MPHDGATAEIKVREGSAVWREIDGETVLLALDSSQYFNVNAAGTVLWAGMVDGTNADAMADALVERFAIGRVRAEADVARFVSSCRECGLLA